MFHQKKYQQQCPPPRSNGWKTNRATPSFSRIILILSFLACTTTTVTSSTFSRTTTISTNPFRLKSLLPNPNVKQQQIYKLQQLRGGGADQGRPSWTAGSTPLQQQQQTSSGSRNQYSSSSVSKEDELREKEMTKEMMNAFLKRDDRQTFIARVYSILACQLLVTSIFVFLFGTHPEWRFHMMFGKFGRAVLPLCMTASCLCTITLSSSLRLRRSKSKSFQLLSLFTITESIMVGFITSFYKFQSVISAMLLTACSTLSITMYTILQKNPKWDLSLWGSGLFSCTMIFVLYGFVNLLTIAGWLPAGFLPYNDMLYSLLGACLFSLYLAYHTRLIVSGKYTKIQMNEKDHVLGAMCLYTDIINIFIYILRIVGEDRD